MGGAVPGQVVRCSVRKIWASHVEQTRAQHSSMASAALFDVLPSWAVMGKHRLAIDHGISTQPQLSSLHKFSQVKKSPTWGEFKKPDSTAYSSFEHCSRLHTMLLYSLLLLFTMNLRNPFSKQALRLHNVFLTQRNVMYKWISKIPPCRIHWKPCASGQVSDGLSLWSGYETIVTAALAGTEMPGRRVWEFPLKSPVL